MDNTNKECLEIKQEIPEDGLSKVTGGVGTRMKTIVIEVTLPSDRTETAPLNVYVDGILESSMTKTLDPCVVIVSLSFKAAQGKMRVDIKLNNKLYKEYVLNFDDGSYNVL